MLGPHADADDARRARELAGLAEARMDGATVEFRVPE